MTHIAGTRRLALVGACALLFVGATAPPAPQTIRQTPPGVVKKVKLSDTITFRGKTCSLVSAGDDADSPKREVMGWAVQCLLKPGPNNMISVTVPGDPDEMIFFTYTVTPGTTLVTGRGTEDTQSGGGNTVTISGNIVGVPGTAGGSGTISVYEPFSAP